MIKALKQIYKGNEVANADLFQITNEALQGSIDSSIDLEYNVTNQTLINQLRTNAGVFAAFKSHKQTEAIAALLIDDQGEIVPFGKFKKEALKISDKYNKDWLRTEYNTALRRGSMAERFTRFKEDSDLYANLRWLQSTSGEPRGQHIKYYGLVLPIDHPFWAEQFPGVLWNCKCDIEQTDDKAGRAPSDWPEPPAGLEGNPAFTGELIGTQHPYFSGVPNSDGTVVSRLVQRDTEKRVSDWAKNTIDTVNGLIITNKVLHTGQMMIRRGDIKTLSRKITDPFLKTYPTVLSDDVDNWEYVGFAEVEPGKHKGVTKFLYYKTTYGDEEIFINVKLHPEYGERPYAISVGIDNKRIEK